MICKQQKRFEESEELRKAWLLFRCVIMVSLSVMTVTLFAAPPSVPPGKEEVSGILLLRSNEFHFDGSEGPETTWLIRDTKTRKGTELDISGLDKAQLAQMHRSVGKQVKARGAFRGRRPAFAGQKVLDAEDLVYEDAAATDSGSVTSDASGETAVDATVIDTPLIADGKVAPLVDEAAPAVTELRVLSVHANALDVPVNPDKIAAMSNMLFSGTQNLAAAMLHATWGHYTLVNGDTITVNINMNAIGAEAVDIEAAMSTAAGAAGYTPSTYDRVLYFCPDGVVRTGAGGASWTAYGYIQWYETVFSYAWTATYFDAVIHELGHNFGFPHSGLGTDEYGDRTCVMGVSHSSTAAPRYTSTYSSTKKIWMGWVNQWPGSYTSITSDATFEIYPISQTPEGLPGVRSIRLADSDYYVSYVRYLLPYGWLRYTTDGDKMYVHKSNADVGAPYAERQSWRMAGLVPGGAYAAGTGTNVICEIYGTNGSVFVSVDFPDGNAKPVANAQAPVVYVNTPKAITLIGSDADADELAYSIYLAPTNGALTGTGTNRTYTPDTDYIGPDSFVFRVDDGNISSFATVSITVSAPEVSVTATDAAASEAGPDGGEWLITRTGNTTLPLDVYFTLGGTATLTDDYTVNDASPVTIAAGQSNATVTLTPVDDSTVGEGDETVVFTIIPNASYTIGTATATVTIVDNDYIAPTVSNYGYTVIDLTSADVSGYVSAGGVVDAWICWGSRDGGDVSTGNWEQVEAVGMVNVGNDFFVALTGLSTNTTYWYRCYVTNSTDEAWSPVAGNFSVAPVHVGSDEFQQDSGPQGIVSIEAEHFSQNIAGDTHDWVLLEEVEASGGQAMDSSPDIGATKASITGSPRLRFDVKFVKTGVHYFWVLGRAYARTDLVGNADSVYCGYDGASIGQASATAAYSWKKAAGTITVDTAGVHTVDVFMREDGFVCDKILLTTDVAYTPTGFGAAESSRGLTRLIANIAPTGITNTAATLNAVLDPGGTSYDVHVFWGTVDGGTNAGGWSGQHVVGAFSGGLTNASHAASLNAGQTYYYTFMASNAVTNVWAIPSWQFRTLGADSSIAAPTGLGATPVSTSQINLTWTDNSTNETGFLIERSTTSGSGFALLGNAAANTQSYSDMTVSPGLTYYYQVTATNASESSAASAQASATVPKMSATVTLSNTNQVYTGAPRTVGTSTTPGGLTVDVTYNGNTYAPTNAGTYSVTGTVNEVSYEGWTNGTLVVSKATPTVTTWPTASAIEEGQSLASSTLSGGDASVGGSYAFSDPSATPSLGTNTGVVVIFSPTDNLNYNSLTGSVTVVVAAAVPDVPTGLIATPSVGQVSLSWLSANNAAGYNVKYSTTQGGAYTTVGGPTTTNYTHTGLANGVTYYYVVSAVNGGVESADSVEVSVTLYHVVPFAEDFESLNTGDLDGQNMWVASNATVQTGVALGSQAASITSATGYVEHELWGSATNVWTDLRIQPVFSSTAQVPPRADIATGFYFNTNGNPVVYDGTNAVTLTGVSVSTGTWVRLTTESDYQAKTWNLYVNESQVATNLGFYDDTLTYYELFGVTGGADADTLLDDVGITTSSPLNPPAAFMLTVVSAYGTANPAGVTYPASNSLVNAWISGTSITNGMTNYVCTGWIGTGSAPASGTNTSMSFAITNDTTLTWTWTTNYWVELNVAGE